MTKPALLLFLAAILAAVEVGPVEVVRVIDGDTIAVTMDGKEAKVRLLYIDTAETKDNSHGKEMAEGKTAKAALTAALDKRSVYLSSPGDALKEDKYDRLLAVVRDPLRCAAGGDTIQAMLVLEGHSVYWRKYGEAPAELHDLLVKCQDEAEKAGSGTWSTNPKWMKDKSNERTAPKAEKAKVAAKVGE